jgi:beta-lactamase superfamily II metal-dependent hydrolase
MQWLLGTFEENTKPRRNRDKVLAEARLPTPNNIARSTAKITRLNFNQPAPAGVETKGNHDSCVLLVRIATVIDVPAVGAVPDIGGG